MHGCLWPVETKGVFSESSLAFLLSLPRLSSVILSLTSPGLLTSRVELSCAGPATLITALELEQSMSLLRPFSALDLFEFNAINLDVWTETYGVGYYLGYLMQWGDLFS